MNRPLKIVLIAVVLLVAVAGGGLWWFLRDDAPPAVALSTAVESVTTSTAADTVTTEAIADDISGSWSVDTETGAFDYESATGTFAGFRIQEQLVNIGSATAVGRTGGVTGTIEIDGTVVTSASFVVDLTTITTNEDRRDDKVQSALETTVYPTATFVLTSPIELGDTAASGDAVSVTAVGELALHGVTRAVELPLEAQLVDGTIVVVGSLDVTFSEYGVEVPQSQLVLSVEDHGVLELQFLLTRT